VTAAPAVPATRRARILVGQVLVGLALFTTSGAAVAVLLPARVAELDTAGKVGALAAILTTSFVVTAVAQPAIGALSDRTRTRFGRRLPWMAGAALVAGLAVGSVGDAPSVVLLGAAWVVAQAALDGVRVMSDSYLVDAFPAERRGIAAGVVGLAVVAGAAVGALLSGAFVAHPVAVSWSLAGLIVAAVVVFAALVRDPPLDPVARRRAPLGAAVRGLVATLRAHPDFLRILLWRFAFSIAYGTVFGFLLYVLTDLVGVPAGEAARLAGLATALGGATAAASVLLGGRLSDRLGRRRPFVLVGGAALVLGDLLVLVSPTVPAVVVTAVVFGAGLGLSISCGRALASQVLPGPTVAAAAGLGTVNVATALGQALAPAIGALAITWGGYPALFVASIAAAVVASAPVLLIRSVR